MSATTVNFPQDSETEKALLAVLLEHRGEVQSYCETPLHEELFHLPEHRELFRLVMNIPGNVPLGMEATVKYIATAELFDFKRHPGILEGMGCERDLLELTSFYVEKLSELARKRETQILALKLQQETIGDAEKERLQELLAPQVPDETNQPGPRSALRSFHSSHSSHSSGKTNAATVEPVLREEALYGMVGDIIRKIMPHTETHPAALLFQLLVGIGNLIGRTAYFTTERDRQHCNLFALVVGASSRGRKGTSWGQVRHILQCLEPEWERNRIMGGLASGEGLIAELQDPRQEDAEKEGEASNAESCMDKRLLVFEGEFGHVLRVLQREGNTLSGIVRNAWDTGHLRNMSKGAPLQASDCHISMIGHITRNELNRLLTANDTSNGFANRILWVHSDRVQMLPDGGDLESVSFENELDWLRRAIALARTRGKVERSPKCKDRWREVYARLTEDVPGRWGEVTSRSEAQVTRISLIFALLDGSMTIDIEHLEAACAVWDYASASARWIFEKIAFSPDAQMLLKALQTFGPLSRKEISDRVFQRNRTAKQIEKALAEIAELTITEDRPGEGRTGKVISLRESVEKAGMA